MASHTHRGKLARPTFAGLEAGHAVVRLAPDGWWLRRSRELMRLLVAGVVATFARVLRRSRADSDAKVVARLGATATQPRQT